MPDYEKMYHEMVRETEAAINILIAAQRRCEEMYVDASPPQIIVRSGIVDFISARRRSGLCKRERPGLAKGRVSLRLPPRQAAMSFRA